MGTNWLINSAFKTSHERFIAIYVTFPRTPFAVCWWVLPTLCSTKRRRHLLPDDPRYIIQSAVRKCEAGPECQRQLEREAVVDVLKHKKKDLNVKKIDGIRIDRKILRWVYVRVSGASGCAPPASPVFCIHLLVQLSTTSGKSICHLLDLDALLMYEWHNIIRLVIGLKEPNEGASSQGWPGMGWNRT